MTKQAIGIGAAADDGTGDPLRTAFNKANLNFDELYAFLGGSTLNLTANAVLRGNGTGALQADTKFTFGPAAGQGPTIAPGTATTDVSALNITQGWNAALIFTGLKFKVTGTSYTANSMLFDFGTTTDSHRLHANLTGSSFDLYVDGPSSGSGRILLRGNGAANNHQLASNNDGTLSLFNYTGAGIIDIGAQGTGAAGIRVGTSAGLVEINNNTPGTYRDLKVRKHYVDQTVTAAGTTGAQTINKSAGTVNFAAGATSLVVTNSLVTTSSTIHAEIRTNDATARIANVVPAAGSFTINLTAAATAETSVGFHVLN